MVIIVGSSSPKALACSVGTATWTPKLALDLEGGTQIILAPELESGQTVTAEQLDQAVSIIRQRVDASGVSEAEITTQGASNVVVSLPGTPDEETLDRIQSSAKLEFRAVLYRARGRAVADETPDPATTRSPEGETADSEPTLAATPTATPTDGSDLDWVTAALQAEYDTFDCASARRTTNVAPADEPLVTCDADGTVKYILGPVEVDGAASRMPAGLVVEQQGVSTGQWVVNIAFDDEGTKQFGDVTTRLFGLDRRRSNQFAIVLDGPVISAPTTQRHHHRRQARRSPGRFTQEIGEDARRPAQVRCAADQLRRAELRDHLGDPRLDAAAIGLIAGLIGLLLVVIYSLIQYRAARLVTIASLIVAAVPHLPHHHASCRGAGLPPVARRCRGSDRGDRYHGRLVHRLLRANPRRAARRQVR